MKILLGGRRHGKTSAMLQWVREAPKGEHRVIVCFSQQEAARLARENPDIPAINFIGPRAYHDGFLGRHGEVRLAIDNVDMWLQNFFAFPIDWVTFTKDPEV